MENEVFSPKSQYNEAINQLNRLNEIWKACHEFRKVGNLSQWNIQLDCAWSELSSDNKLTDEDDIKKYKLFNKCIIKYKNKKNLLYQTLAAKEIFLKTLQNTQGKGSRYEDDLKGL
jgi:hypothetical protein